jgi:hypothetical protein
MGIRRGCYRNDPLGFRIGDDHGSIIRVIITVPRIITVPIRIRIPIIIAKSYPWSISIHEGSEGTEAGGKTPVVVIIVIVKVGPTSRVLYEHMDVLIIGGAVILTIVRGCVSSLPLAVG